jgi:hypothetical protein
LKIVPIGAAIGSSNGWIVKAIESTSVWTRVPTEPQTLAGMTQPDVSIAAVTRSTGAWIGPVRRGSDGLVAILQRRIAARRPLPHAPTDISRRGNNGSRE